MAAICRRVRFTYVTIEPDAASGSVGHVRFKGNTVTSLDSLGARAVVALAGEAAQRHYSPRSVRRHQAGGDRDAVVDIALRATGSAEKADLLVRFWAVCARDLVASRWSAVNQVAEALLERRTLTMAEAVATVSTNSKEASAS